MKIIENKLYFSYFLRKVFKEKFKNFLFRTNLTIFTIVFLEHRYIFNTAILLCSHFAKV